MSITRSSPEEKTIAFGGVAMGSMNANDVESAACVHHVDTHTHARRQIRTQPNQNARLACACGMYECMPRDQSEGGEEVAAPRGPTNHECTRTGTSSSNGLTWRFPASAATIGIAMIVVAAFDVQFVAKLIPKMIANCTVGSGHPFRPRSWHPTAAERPEAEIASASA